MTVNYSLSTDTKKSDKIIDKNTIISVVIEGYNQSRDLGTVNDTLQALKKQTFPLKQVEIILVGSSIQTQGWEKMYRNDTDFLSIKTLSYDDANYYELKNGGANLANGDIVAFTDSDVCPKPSWLSAIAQGIAQGADVVVGPSLFRQPGGLSSDSAVFRRHQYRTEFGRIIASPLLYRSLANDGLNIAYQSQQQAGHFFSWKYWLISLHFRYGYEVYNIRRLDSQYPNQWITKTGIFEPIVTWIWHILLDIPRWFRFSSHLTPNLPYRLACFPLLLIFSIVGRGSEMMGMYATMFNPSGMKQWAENV